LKYTHEPASPMTNNTVMINKMITDQPRTPAAEVLLCQLDSMYLLR